MTNIAMEVNPTINGGFVRWEHHLFSMGHLYHGELLVITRLGISLASLRPRQSIVEAMAGHWWLGDTLPDEEMIPSGKRLHNYGKSPFLMGKLTINGHFQ